jgi:N-acetyl-alpha-D-muramate 1-phosphate uridylyltransferase
MKAMILAAGKGTRLLPLTEHLPKALLKIQNVPLLQHCILYFKYFGVNEIIINVHHLADQIIEFLAAHDNFGIRIEISDESEELLDTGGGLLKAHWFFSDGNPFFLATSDVITDLNLEHLYKFHVSHQPLTTLAVKQRKSTRELLLDEHNNLCGWRNNINNEYKWSRQPESYHAIAFSTVHVIDPALFGLITERGAFSMTDLYLRLARDHTIKGFEHNDSRWFECGRVENLEMLNESDEIQTIYRKYHGIK